MRYLKCTSRKTLRRVFYLLTALVLISCGGSSTTSSSETAEATYDSLWSVVFSKECGSCHAPGLNSATDGGPDLSSKDSFYTGLVGRTGADFSGWSTLQGTRSNCVPYSFIDPGHADQSLVIAVLEGTSLGSCVIKSHKEGPQNIQLSAANLLALRQWIDAGAER